MDELKAALGITAVIAAVQEIPLGPVPPPPVWKAARLGLAVGASFMINRRGTWQRHALTVAGVWGAAELCSLSYSVLLMGADNLLFRINQLQRRR